jgi:glycosyltransferase involved in cell wall biosynthesis
LTQPSQTATLSVSIVTPSLNQAEFIAETIASVLNQDYPALEFLVVDGGSTDGTLDILRGYGGRIRWTSGSDDGQSDAINRGIAATSGEIVAWLNADDVYVPGAVARAAAAFAEDPTRDLVYGQAAFIDRSGKPLGDEAHGEPWSLEGLINRTNFIQQPAAFFRRRAFDAVGGLDVGLHYVMDYDLWIKLGSRGRVHYVPEVFAKVRWHEHTKTVTGGVPRYAEMERMTARYGRKRVPEAFEPEMLRALARASGGALRRRSLGEALGHARHAAPYALRATRRRALRAVRGRGDG